MGQKRLEMGKSKKMRNKKCLTMTTDVLQALSHSFCISFLFFVCRHFKVSILVFASLVETAFHACLDVTFATLVDCF
jgi:hypothetical protein